MTIASPLQRLRVTYQHGEPLRYIGHLDLLRALERAMRRAGLPIAYTQGFNPRPRITFAAPLPLGFLGEIEYVDFLMERPFPPAEFVARLQAQLFPGFVLLAAEEIERSAPALPALLRRARYRVLLCEYHDQEGVHEAIVRLLAAPYIERPKRGKAAGRGVYDLRPRIIELGAESTLAGVELDMLLTAGERDTARPEEVLAALGFAALPVRIRRTRLFFAEAVGQARSSQQSG